jgi:heterodisulfide reductase subunit A
MTDIEGRILHSELSLGPNAAITIPFRQAIPNVPRIHPNRCIHMKTGGCMLCTQVCQKEAINFTTLAQETFEEFEVGAVIMATGFQDFNPAPMKQYGYGDLPNVLTSDEFERMNNAASPTGGRIVMENGEEPRSIAILHCVGSRDEKYHKYCSRVCCMYALKFAHLVKEKTSAEVYQLYIDMRSFGKGYEEFYQRILDEGVNVIRGKGAEVVPAYQKRRGEGGLLVCCEDTLIGKYREIPVDMVVLCTALEARSDAAEIGRKFNISVGADGWFIEAHPKLAPVSTTTEGIFLAGVCQGAKDIPDSVAQGTAAAAQVMKMFCQGELLMDAAYAEIVEDICSGCRICNGLCPYNAISYEVEKKVSVVNPAMCKACGTCVAACPSGAITGRHFTDEQIYAQIEGILA